MDNRAAALFAHMGDQRGGRREKAMDLHLKGVPPFFDGRFSQESCCTKGPAAQTSVWMRPCAAMASATIAVTRGGIGYVALVRGRLGGNAARERVDRILLAVIDQRQIAAVAARTSATLPPMPPLAPITSAAPSGKSALSAMPPVSHFDNLVAV